MSILITGIDMPKKGNPITVLVYPDGTAEWQNKEGTAVPVPEHGRLIDADALKTMWDDEVARLLEKGTEYLDYRVDTLFSDFKNDVDKMPTIIPASEEDMA